VFICHVARSTRSRSSCSWRSRRAFFWRSSSSSARVLGAQPAAAESLLDHDGQVGDVLERLGDVVVGALSQCVDRGLHRGVARHQDHRDLGVDRARVAHDIEAGLTAG